MTSKIPNALSLSKEEQFTTFQQEIQELDKLHVILQKPTINSDQSPFSHLTVGNTTLTIFATKSVILKRRGNKKKLEGLSSTSPLV